MLGVPSNQFGDQEPGTDAEILEFVTTEFDVDFPMFSKVDVNGDGESELYTLLKAGQPGDGDTSDIVWNFEKFLVGGDGTVLARYGPRTTPEEVGADLGRFR